MLPRIYKALDKAAKEHIIHKNKASREIQNYRARRVCPAARAPPQPRAAVPAASGNTGSAGVAHARHLCARCAFGSGAACASAAAFTAAGGGSGAFAAAPMRQHVRRHASCAQPRRRPACARHARRACDVPAARRRRRAAFCSSLLCLVCWPCVCLSLPLGPSLLMCARAALCGSSI